MSQMSGSIEQFNSLNGDIESYIERVEQYFVCNDVSAERQVPLLISLMGPEAYGVLKKLLSPELPSTKSIEQLKDTLQNHFAPKRLVIVERFVFYNEHQRAGQSVSEFIMKIKGLAKTCVFGNFLQEALRDKLVCGLQNKSLQKRLLSEENLTFGRASEIALAFEASELQAKPMHPTVSPMYYRPQYRPNFVPAMSRAMYSGQPIYSPNPPNIGYGLPQYYYNTSQIRNPGPPQQAAAVFPNPTQPIMPNLPMQSIPQHTPYQRPAVNTRRQPAVPIIDPSTGKNIYTQSNESSARQTPQPITQAKELVQTQQQQKPPPQNPQPDVQSDIPKPCKPPVDDSTFNDDAEANGAVISNDKLVQAKNEANAKISSSANGDYSTGALIDTKENTALPYQDDQWAPNNQDGKRVYQKDFLMALKEFPASIKKPDHLPDFITADAQPLIPNGNSQLGKLNGDGGGEGSKPKLKNSIKKMLNKSIKNCVVASHKMSKIVDEDKKN